MVLPRLNCLRSKSHNAYAAAKSLQSCPTLCDPMDCSPPGSSVHGIFQARVLEWVATASPGKPENTVKINSRVTFYITHPRKDAF